MKKTLLCLAVALLMLICLCACGKHVHEYGEWQTEVEATCNTVAKEVRYCECGAAERRSVGDPLGHSFGDWSTVTAASCVVDGIDERFCSRCDYKEMRTVSSEKHSYGNWYVVVLATCMEEGIVYRTCSDCGNKDFATIEPSGQHTEVIDEAVEATCSTVGLSQGKHCSSCGAVIVAQVEIAKTSHSYSSDSDNSCNVCGFIRDVACQHTSVTTLPAKAPTCTEPGLTEGKVCNSCEYIIAEQTVIPYTGHSEVAIPAISPTCTSTGKSEGVKCSVCDTILVSQKTVEMSPHSYVSGKCTVCGDFEDKTPLEVSSISVDKSLVMTYNEVNFIVTSNKLPEQLTISAVIFLDGARVASIHGVGSLRYIPTVAGKYDAEISVTSDGINVCTSYIEDCFEVKDGWALSGFSADRNSITLGEKLTFSATIDGSTTDLSYEIDLYRNDELISTYEGVSEVEVYPGSEGTYHAVIIVTDSYGERYTLKSQSVTATLNTSQNPIYTVNQGTTLNLDELNGKAYYEAVVPAGKDIKLEWSKQSGDAYYEIYGGVTDNETDSYEFSFENYTSNTYTISSNNLIPGHKYQVYVDRIDSSGRLIGDFSLEFVVAGADSIFLEGGLKLINPISSGVTPYSDLTLQWTKFNNASKYVISLDYSCGAAYHTIFKDVEVSGSQNYYSISKSDLKQGCYYRIKIYVYDELGNKTYIKKYFDVEGDEELFRVSTPEITNSDFYNNMFEVNKTYPSCEYLIVTWKDIPSAAYYSVTLDCKRSDYPDPVLVNADRIEGNSYAIPVKDLLSGCLYSIKVAAYCADGHDESTKAMYFRAPYTDGRELYPPEITSHDFSQDLNQPTTMVEQGFTFTWAPVSAAVTYSVFWYEYGYEDDVDYELKDTTSTTVTIPKDCVYSSQKGTDCVLEIVAFDENDNSVTAYYYIRMVSSTIEAPIVTSPGLPTNDDGTLPSFDDDFTIRWSAVKDAVSYKVVIAEYDDEYYTILTYDNITDTFLEIPVWDELYEGCKYRIRVYAYDQYGNGLSSKYYFMVGEPDYMELSKDNLNFNYKASHQYTVLTTVGNWTAKSSDSWITLDSYSGSDANRFKVSVTENTSDFARFGTVTFTNSAGGIVILTVSQDGNNASNSGRVQITSPTQGSTIERDSITVKWSCKCDHEYFGIELVDVTTGKTVYTKENITGFYDQIPESYITSGHTYQIILYVWNLSNVKSTAASIAFKVEGGNSGYEPEQTPANFTVTFKDYDGTVLKVQTGIQYGKGATAPYVPDRAGYSFVGWNKSFSNVTSDLTVVAVYEATASTECTHANKSFVRYDYEDFTYISTSTHSVKEISTYKCPDCSKIIETSRVKTESHVRDFEVNGGWACRCGHTQSINFTPYTANLQSEVNRTTYYDSELTIRYGTVYVTDEIIVLGSVNDAYLIKYPLDNGGYKCAFISKQYIDVYSDGNLGNSNYYAIYLEEMQVVKSSARCLVGAQYSYYQIYIMDLRTREILQYGSDNTFCVSNNESLVSIGPNGTMVIHLQGTTEIDLVKDSVVMDTIVVHGCSSEAELIVVDDVDATCTEYGGTRCEYCSECFEFFVSSNTIPAKGHQFVDGACLRCWVTDINNNKYRIQESCVWYSENYDYIMGYSDSWTDKWTGSKISDSVKSPSMGAISHVLLLSPDDALDFAKIFSKDATLDAWKTFANYLISIGTDKLTDDMFAENVCKGYADTFLSSVISSNSEDIPSFLFDIAKSLLFEAVKKGTKLGIGTFVEWMSFITEFVDNLYLAYSISPEIIECAEAGYGVSIYFYYEYLDVFDHVYRVYATTSNELSYNLNGWKINSVEYAWGCPIRYKTISTVGPSVPFKGYFDTSVEAIDECIFSIINGEVEEY